MIVGIKNGTSQESVIIPVIQLQINCRGDEERSLLKAGFKDEYKRNCRRIKDQSQNRGKSVDTRFKIHQVKS